LMKRIKNKTDRKINMLSKQYLRLWLGVYG
jgi:hypothetical protein